MYKRCERCCKITNKLTNDLCNACFVLVDRKYKKEELIKYKGGKCERCGYNQYNRCLVFHHINPEEKEFDIARGHCLDIDKLKKEADKCQLLCVRCHQEEHERWDEIKRIKKLADQRETNSKVDFYKFIQEQYNKMNKPIRQSECPYCKNVFNNPTNKKFCSKQCCANARIIKTHGTLNPGEHIPKEELQQLLWEKPRYKIANHYGVTTSVVDRKIQEYNLVEPPSSYWSKLENRAKLK